MINKKIKNRKALSPIIATVLLILLSIAGISIIAGVLIPFVKEKMQEAKECSQIIEVEDALKIDTENGFACYYDDGGVKKAKITIHRGNIELYGIRVALIGEGDSKVVDIIDGEENLGIEMLDGGEAVLPGKGGEKTYIIDTSMTTLKNAIIAPMMSSKNLCKETDNIELVSCSE